MKHLSNPATSPRLQRVFALLCDAGADGITTFELQLGAKITAPVDALYELRRAGQKITSEWETRGGKTYKRHFLTSLKARA